MAATVQHLWCVGKHALPFQQDGLDLVSLANPEQPEVLRADALFFLLSLKVSQQSSWMGRARNMPVRWWWSHGLQQPLIQELVQAIPGPPRTGRGFAGVAKNIVVPGGVCGP